MRIFLRPSFLFALPLLCAIALAADKTPDKADKLTLEDVIFDVSYLKQMLGPKTLLSSDKKSGELSPETQKFLATSELKNATRFFGFPAEATKPKLYYSIPYAYPESLSRVKNPGSAHFLVLVGTDGKVKTLYCYQHTDRIFALVSAAAIVRFRYEPAKINGTPVPVLMDFPTSFNRDEIDTLRRRLQHDQIPRQHQQPTETLIINGRTVVIP